jgi:hypothetical protein
MPVQAIVTTNSIRKTSARVSLLWLAGLLEGEGWFGERRGKDRSPRPMIALKMTDRDVVERVAGLFGGMAVTKIPGYYKQDQFVTRVTSHKALSIMRQILPYMGKRRSKTIEMLLWLYPEGELLGNSGKTHCPKGHRYDYISPMGKRGCRRCRNEASRKHRAV